MKVKKKNKKLTKQELMEKEAKLWEIRYFYNEDARYIEFHFIDSQRPRESHWDNDSNWFRIYTEPTGNCQLMTAADFEYVGHVPECIRDIIIKSIFSITYSLCAKRMLLIDTKEKNADDPEVVRELIRYIGKFNPNASTCYNSSNGSRMRTSVIRLDPSKYYDRGFEDYLYSCEEGGVDDLKFIYTDND